MLTWLVKEVPSPYGEVATLHWAVPDADYAGDDDDDSHNPLHVALESAEDQLGAVLWNSNSAALRHLHRHVLRLPTPPDTSAKVPLAGRNVVELGAGVGCLGIALAMAGARVAITDLKELLPLMEHNVHLNDKRVQTRSGGVGRCVALQWRWGPTASTSVHKQLQKAGITEPSSQAQSSGDRTAPAPSASGTGSSDGSSPSAVERVVATMVEALLSPSASLLECEAALKRSGLPARSAAAAAGSSTPFHHVILCDALYGNPRDWPALLYTLTELLATNPAGCEIVNFCEQRVDDVEGAFLRLLDGENAKPFVPFNSGNRSGDALWAAVVKTASACCTSLPTAASAAAELHARREEAASALLHYALVQRRGHYAWAYETQVVQEAQSELNMTIRVTRIRWVRGESVVEQDDREAHAKAAQSRRRPRDAAGDTSSSGAAHAGAKRQKQQ